MQWTRRQTGWALLLTSLIGMGLPAVAPLSGKPAGVDVAAQAQFSEIRVELAMLADARTFPCQLAVRSVGGIVEVSGPVSSPQLRQHVLQVARRHSLLPVGDKLTIQPGAELPVKGGNDKLCSSAIALLGKTLNKNPDGFLVSADPAGRIMVAGTIGSYEDKLHISRRLSQLPGCTSVSNELVVTPLTRDGQAWMPVSADGQRLLPGEPGSVLTTRESPPTKPASTVVEARPAPVQKQEPARAPAKMDQQPAVVSRSPAPANALVRPAQMPPSTTRNPMPVKPATMPVAAPVARDAVAVKAAAKETVASRPAPMPRPAITPVARQQAGLPPETSQAKVLHRDQLWQADAGMVPSPVKGQTGAVPSKLAPHSPWSTAIPGVVVQARTVVSPASNQPAVVQAKAEVQPAKLPSGMQPRQPVTPPPAAPARVEFGMDVKPVAAAVSPVRMTPQPLPASARASSPISPRVLESIEQRVEAAGTGALIKVKVTAMARTSLRIHAQVRDASAAPALAQKILALPDLRPYHVDLDIEPTKD